MEVWLYTLQPALKRQRVTATIKALFQVHLGSQTQFMGALYFILPIIYHEALSPYAQKKVHSVNDVSFRPLRTFC
jgi:hypothetical protein